MFFSVITCKNLFYVKLNALFEIYLHVQALPFDVTKEEQNGKNVTYLEFYTQYILYILIEVSRSKVYF